MSQSSVILLDIFPVVRGHILVLMMDHTGVDTGPSVGKQEEDSRDLTPYTSRGEDRYMTLKSIWKAGDFLRVAFFGSHNYALFKKHTTGQANAE